MEQVLKLHTSLIRATGGSPDIRDEGMLDMALKKMSGQFPFTKGMAFI
ncbi:MAG: hypothetical protein NC307_13595 [Roseburia sp.]|nr:hypothetical protein [Roseburia sp.]